MVVDVVLPKNVPLNKKSTNYKKNTAPKISLKGKRAL